MVVVYWYAFEVEAKEPDSNHHHIIYAPSPLPLALNIGQHREIMEDHESSALDTMVADRPEVDTARPFRSVKEAVAVFGERFLAGHAYSQKTNSSVKLDATTPRPIYSLPPPPKPILSASSSPPSCTSSASQFNQEREAVAVFGERFVAGDAYSQKTNSSVKLDATTPRPIYSLSPPPKPILSASSSPPSCTSSASQFNQGREAEFLALSSLKKMEVELEETKRELMLLKERESETEIAVANLKRQLHKIMSKLAEMEATKAAESSLDIEGLSTEVESDRWEDERTREMEARIEYLPTLAQALSLGGIGDDFGGRRKRKVAKKKPIIPLVGDMFSRKKGSSDLNSSPYPQSYYSVLT